MLVVVRDEAAQEDADAVCVCVDDILDTLIKDEDESPAVLLLLLTQAHFHLQT